MASASRSSHPVENLHELSQSLEAAMLECLARPGKKNVHKLRTSTRRMEAQLLLLDTLPHLPPHRKVEAHAMKLLRKLRRCAGRVRDLDVQQELVQRLTAARNHPNAAISDEARKLNQALAQKRDKKADELQSLLHQTETRLPLVFKELRDALAPAAALALAEPRLIALIRKWYARRTPAKVPNKPARLHDIRKQAKLARYLAESAPQSATRALQLAAKYEELQEAGGKWHDFLLLADVAANELGKSAQLPERFHARAERSLAIYKRKLAHKI